MYIDFDFMMLLILTLNIVSDDLKTTPTIASVYYDFVLLYIGIPITVRSRENTI